MRATRSWLWLALLSALSVGCSAPSAAPRGVLYQTSTIGALQAGVFDGELTLAELRTHGDTGLGTFNGLDGEMVMLDGVVYQITVDGKVLVPRDWTKTPFAQVSFFVPERTASAPGPMTLAQLTTWMDSVLPTVNVPYVVKITGDFQTIRTRSVPKQTEPYPPLAEAVKGQKTFDLASVRGTAVGLRMPAYAAGLGVAGYHIHFITDDRSAGGHVLDMTVKDVKVQFQPCGKMEVSLPDTPAFHNAVLNGTGTDAGEIKKD
jgi:acetolactate decarboxylase